MLNKFPLVTNMKKYTSFLIVVCLFVCLRFNSTFPLSRDLSRSTQSEAYPNVIRRCDLIERTKKMTSTLENSLRRIKDSTQELSKSIYDHLNTGIRTLATKDAITEDDLRHYEELVIMKKYPYLDLKALEMKYSPMPFKNTRQSATFAVDHILQNEPGINCDRVEDLINVEIINRGLSGFAIPPLLAKQTESEDKIKNNGVSKTFNTNEDPSVLQDLKNEIIAYVQKNRIGVHSLEA